MHRRASGITRPCKSEVTPTAKSTRSQPNDKPIKPDKPYDGFPLFAHATGRWAKKIRGKLHYFGPWGDPEGTLVRFNREWPYLSEGRTRPAIDVGDACTLRALCHAFLTSKQNKLGSGELSQRSFREVVAERDCGECQDGVSVMANRVRFGERQMGIYQHTSTTCQRVSRKPTCLRCVLVCVQLPLAFQRNVFLVGDTRIAHRWGRH